MDNPNINTNFTPTPKPKNKFGSIVWIILFILLAVAAVLIFLTLRGKKNTQQQPPSNQTQSINNLQKEQSALLSQSKIKFPTITKAEVISSSTLPSDISRFIHSGADGLQVEKITLDSQGTGYRIKYQISASDMQPLYFSFNTNPLPSGYKAILGLRGDDASLIEMQSNSYQIRISLNMVEDNVGNVLIIVLPL